MSSTYWYKTVVTLVIPTVILITVLNILMIAHFHGRDTSLIYRNVYTYQSSDTSDSDLLKVGQLRRGNGQPELIKRPEEEFELPNGNKAWEADGYAGMKAAAKLEAKDEMLFPDIVMQDSDIDEMINKLYNSVPKQLFPVNFWRMSLNDLTQQLVTLTHRTAKTLVAYQDMPKANASMDNWRKFHRNIRQFSLYDPEDPTVDALLHDMANLPITEAEETIGGTELKLSLRLGNNGRVIMKPMRYGRDVETNPNVYIFDDMERHIAEIAAFQLDRLLGFYRVPPTVGRRLSLKELKAIAPSSVSRTYFTSPAGNTCFYGDCRYYCDSAHAFCGNPDMIEVSLMAYLPTRKIAPRKTWYQPWRRSYSRWRKAFWELHPEYCASIRNTSPFNNGKLLCDIIDAHTFDFLIGNKDRHNFATFTEFGNFSFPIMYDNGRGFGRKSYDAMSILAPLRQCCLIRKSTFLKYVKLYAGPEPLSVLMERALAQDPVAPVLIRGHLTALDRRTLKILKEVAICLKKFPVEQVIVHDNF